MPGKLRFFYLVIFFSFFNCSPPNVNPVKNYSTVYKKAVKDAEIAEATEISKNLIAIRKDNPNLIWKDPRKKEKVLVVTWSNYLRFAHYINKELKLPREIWITIVPELKNFCRSLKEKKGLKLRLIQLLGLSPNQENTLFVEFYVSPSDLFRPTPDPKITGTTAGLDYPPDVSKEHKAWIETRKKYSYGKYGTPWTRLGYTYDWGNPETEEGLSEFVVQNGSTIEIKMVYENKTYCLKE